MTTEPDQQLFYASLRQALASIRIDISDEQMARMWQHFQLVADANTRFNLTRITSVTDAAVKHYADSLSLLASPLVDPKQHLRVLDVGTGAGFPAAPLAIVCPQWDVTAIDGTGKKARFVAESATTLELTNLHAVHARGGEIAHSRRGAFDLILLRAVTQIGPALKEVTPAMAAKGQIVFYKTPAITQDEMNEGLQVADMLKLQIQQTWDVEIAAGEAAPIQRRLICCSR